jgi:hypothetical protein
MLPIYGEKCLSRQAVYSWVQKFSEGRTRIEEEHRVNAVETSCVACQKFKVTPSSRKVMLTVFWNHEGILLTASQPQGQTLNADSYCNIRHFLGVLEGNHGKLSW